MRRYIDEYFSKDSNLIIYPDEIIDTVMHLHCNSKSMDDIIEYLIDWLYIFDDKNEKEHYKLIITNIIEGYPVVNRFTNEIFN